MMMLDDMYVKGDKVMFPGAVSVLRIASKDVLVCKQGQTVMYIPKSFLRPLKPTRMKNPKSLIKYYQE